MDRVTPPFRVLPWDFFPDPNAAPPHVEAIQISGAPRRFELLKRGERVYFRLHDDAARVWATLDNCDDADVVRTFRRAIGSGRFGRVFEHQRGGFGYERNFWFSLLMSARGEVQGREWCATQWFDLQPNSRELHRYLASESRPGIFHAKWKPPFRQVLEQSFARFYEQPFTRQDRDLTAYRWFRGDAALLRQLIVPFIWKNALSKDAVSPAITLMFSTEYPEDKPESTPKPLYLKEQFFPLTLRELIPAHFEIGGISWEVSHFHEAEKRQFWDLHPLTHTMKVSSIPSAHQQLEAHLFLRDWLTGKLPPAQVGEILNSLRP